MNLEQPGVVTAPAASFSFSFNVPPQPVMAAPTGPADVQTSAPPLSSIRHLLSGKPLMRPNPHRQPPKAN